MKVLKSRAALMLAAFTCAAVALAPVVAAKAGQNDDKKKPKISVRANPHTGFSPVRIRVSAELKGGDNDHPDYYCPTVEWIWGDDTRAESSVDCDPYEAGKSEIKRRYTLSRTFNMPGEYRVEVRLKQKDRIVASAGTTVRVQPGVRSCCS